MTDGHPGDDDFGALHPSVRYLVQEVLRFPELRPVQASTVLPVTRGLDCVVLAPTAGGKTEAAALPVLSRILSERLPPVAALYVCPLRALLNNIEPRLQRMAEAVGLRVGKWHGDVRPAERRKILAEPPDVLLITPESLEVLLIGAAGHAKVLLGEVRIAVVDEVHAFAGDPRGGHLLSVLERLQQRGRRPHIQRLGLSATVGNPEVLARWLQGSGAAAPPVVVAPVGERKAPVFQFRRGVDVASAARQIRDLGLGQKRLVFAESRSRAEELARALQDAGVRAWVHHSSVGRAAREEAEAAFEQVPDAVLVATSSLELGIDLADLDHIFQLDAPATVSSLAQRLGRTGRRPGSVPRMTFLAEGPEDLVLALALAELYGERWVEDVRPSMRSWTVLVHQLFANLLERGGCTRGQLLDRVRFVPSFAGFIEEELQRLLDHLLAQGWLEEADGALILGRRAEHDFGRRNFFRLYAVFDTPSTLTVQHGSEEIGTLQSWFATQLGGSRRCFRLAGRSWEAEEVDLTRGVVRARPAAAGQVPMWTGRPGHYGRTVCERILDLIKSQRIPAGCSDDAARWLAAIREELGQIPVGGRVRPVVQGDGRWVWHTYAGGKINAVLARLIEHTTDWPAAASNLTVKVRTTSRDVVERLVAVQEMLVAGEEPELGEWAGFDAGNRRALLSAFQACLPPEAEQEVLRAALLDVDGARAWAGVVEIG